MAGSSEKVNYSVRTSKSIERKMMCEMITSLDHFSKVSEYRYIGMGSKFFTDFVLMHKTFGITDMYSLETKRSDDDKKRFSFNKPFNCIQMVFKNSKEWLNSTQFPWKEKRDIIWLDYDGGFSIKQITDLELCVKKVKSGSVVFVSTNVSFINELRELSPKDRLEKYTELVKNSDYTNHLTAKDMAGDNIYKVVADTFNVAVKNGISECNKVIQKDSNLLNVDQIAYFLYADSFTPMITLGWIVYNNYDKEEIEKCGMCDLEFSRRYGEAPYSITVPVLTYKEIAVLNKNMPDCSYPIEEATFLSQEEIEGYKKIYRYYPTTIETGLVL